MLGNLHFINDKLINKFYNHMYYHLFSKFNKIKINVGTLDFVENNIFGHQRRLIRSIQRIHGDV